MQKSRRPCAVREEGFNGVKAYWPLRLGRQSLGQKIEDFCVQKRTDGGTRADPAGVGRKDGAESGKVGRKGRRSQRMRDLLKR